MNNNKKMEGGGGCKTRKIYIKLYMDTNGYYHPRKVANDHGSNLGSPCIKFKTTNNLNWFLYS